MAGLKGGGGGASAPGKGSPGPQSTLLSSTHVLRPGCLSGKAPARQCRRSEFDPWVRKIPWRRKGQPTPVCLPPEEPGGLHPRSRNELDMTKRLNNSMRVLESVPRTHWPPPALPLPCAAHALPPPLAFHLDLQSCACPVSARSWGQEPRAPSYVPVAGAVRCPAHVGRGAVTRAARAKSPSQGNDLSSAQQGPQEPATQLPGPPHGSDTSPLCVILKPFSSSWSPNSPRREEGNSERGRWRDGGSDGVAGWLGSKSEAATCYKASRLSVSPPVIWG